MGGTVRAVASSARGLRSRPEEFTLMHHYLEEFSRKISSVDKITQRISKEQRGTGWPRALTRVRVRARPLTLSAAQGVFWLWF